MALAPTLYDFQISLSHVDRAIDQPQLGLKVARHPSETMQRLWLRVIAWVLALGRADDLRQGARRARRCGLECRDYTGLVTHWVRVGKADPVKVQRAVDQNPYAKVSVLFESVERLDAFIAETRELEATRVAKAELAAVDSRTPAGALRLRFAAHQGVADLRGRPHLRRLRRPDVRRPADSRCPVKLKRHVGGLSLAGATCAREGGARTERGWQSPDLRHAAARQGPPPPAHR